MQMRLGHVTHTWGRTPIEQVLDEIAAIGYEGVELFATHVAPWRHRPEAFRALLKRRDLVLSSLYYAAPLLDKEAIEREVDEGLRAARFLRALDASHLMVGPGPTPSSGVTGEAYRQMGEALNRLGRACLEIGVYLCYHPHVGGTVENREQIRILFESTDPDLVFFVPDTGHLAKGGSDPVEVLQTYFDRVRFVHLKDMDASKTFVELGRGNIPNRRVLEILAERRYSGWILPEIPPRELSPRENAETSYRWLKEQLAGLSSSH